jgi:hypothetical protein
MMHYLEVAMVLGSCWWMFSDIGFADWVRNVDIWQERHACPSGGEGSHSQDDARKGTDVQFLRGCSCST